MYDSRPTIIAFIRSNIFRKRIGTESESSTDSQYRSKDRLCFGIAQQFIQLMLARVVVEIGVDYITDNVRFVEMWVTMTEDGDGGAVGLEIHRLFESFDRIASQQSPMGQIVHSSFQEQY